MDTTSEKEITGLMLHIQRLSTEDGPGIRTSVFLKQCPLHCRWCHNPESISRQPEIQWLENRCIGCENCVNLCLEKALTMTDAGLVINRVVCTACGICAEECPATALELLGTYIGVDELVSQLLKDRVYYEQSGGGVTFSGGEPVMQPDFVAAVFRRLQEAGTHTALDTCGMVSFNSLSRVLPYTDMVLFDIKLIDPTAHQRFTGQSNDVILQNLRALRDYITGQSSDMRLWIRTPLIPGATATRANMTDIGTFIADNLCDVVERWELCAFNNLCRDQYRRLGIEWEYANTPLLSEAELEEMAECARSSQIDSRIVVQTGATQLDIQA